MDFIKELARRVRRERWEAAKGLCVVTRRGNGRLDVSDFATAAAATDFARRLGYWNTNREEHVKKFGEEPSRIVFIR